MNISINLQQKWLYIVGCETFILPHHLLKCLDDLDYRKPIRVQQCSDFQKRKLWKFL